MRVSRAACAAVCLGLLWAPSALALSYVDQRFKVTGYWTGAEVVALRVQVKDASKDPRKGQVNGALTHVDAAAHVLGIGPITVDWSDSTDFEDLRPGDLQVGKSIKVVGRITAPGRMKAASFALGPRSLNRGTIQLIGAVAAGEADTAKTIKAAMLGVPVTIPLQVFNQRQALAQHPDKRSADDPLTFELFGGPLSVGGEFETTLRWRDNFDLDERQDDRLERLDLEAKLNLFYLFSESTSLFLEGKGTREQELLRDGRDLETESAWERGETWLFFDRLFGRNLGLQIGRQNFSDEREWWWDEDMDGVRLFYNAHPWSTELALTEPLARTSSLEEGIDPEERRVRRTLARVRWDWSYKQRVEAYFLAQDDRSGGARVGTTVDSEQEDENDATLRWFGLRAIGYPDLGGFGKSAYWLDTAVVWGDEALIDYEDAGDDLSRVNEVEQRRVRGWGADLGLSLTLRLPGKPTLSAGYAYGSGDAEPDDDTDRAFRQTGLNDNENRFAGENRFRYYGELLRPELSNLEISTLSLGFHFLDNSSVELAYHRYRQVESAAFLRDARLDLDPNGADPDIGRELDVVFGIDEWQHLALEAVAAVFEAGPAYGAQAGERAHNVFVKLNVSF